MKTFFMIKIITAAIFLLCACGVQSDELMAQAEIINSFICNTYKDYDINPKLLPVKYHSAVLSEEDMMKDVRELMNEKPMSGDIINYPSTTWQEFLEEGVLTEMELNGMIEKIKKYKNGSYLKSVECEERDAKRPYEGIIITCSEPVFTTDLTKFIITIEVRPLNKIEGLPDMAREVVLLTKKNDKWVKLHGIEVD